MPELVQGLADGRRLANPVKLSKAVKGRPPRSRGRLPQYVLAENGIDLIGLPTNRHHGREFLEHHRLGLVGTAASNLQANMAQSGHIHSLTNPSAHPTVIMLRQDRLHRMSHSRMGHSVLRINPTLRCLWFGADGRASWTKGVKRNPVTGQNRTVRPYSVLFRATHRQAATKRRSNNPAEHQPPDVRLRMTCRTPDGPAPLTSRLGGQIRHGSESIG